MSESPAAAQTDPDGTAPEPTPLLAPRDGVPSVTITVGEIASAAGLLASGTGPFAVDAERASGFKYSNRAYLIQIRRAGAGTAAGASAVPPSRLAAASRSMPMP